MASSASFDSMASSLSLNGDSSRPASRHNTRIPAPIERSFADAAAAAPNSVVGRLDMRREPRKVDSSEQVNGTHEERESTINGTKKPGNKSSSFFSNGFAERPPPQLTVEKFQDKDGEHLTTIKSVLAPDDRKPHLERSDTLVSGKRPVNQ